MIRKFLDAMEGAAAAVAFGHWQSFPDNATALAPRSPGSDDNAAKIS